MSAKHSIRIRRLLLVLALAGLVVLRWLDLQPIVLGAGDAERPGKAVFLRQTADVLLLVDAEVVSASGRSEFPQDTDWSYGWLNLADQELGRVAVAGPGEIQGGALEGRRVVVVTGSAIRATELWLPQLKLFVEDGGLLVLERPTNRWDLLSGVEVDTRKPYPLRDLTGIHMAQVLDLPGMPWQTDALPLRVVRSDVEVLAESEGQPMVVRRPMGKGWVLVLALDVGRQIVSLQQGTPVGGSTQIVDRHPRVLRPGLHSDDLVSDARLLGSMVPYADVFERFIMSLLDDCEPLPRWWLFPYEAPGAFLMTHDEGGLGERAAWMAAEEIEQGLASTCFVAMGPWLGPAGLKRFASEPGRGCAAMGLAWHLGSDDEDHAEALGFWRIEPLRRRRSLEREADWFEQLTGHRPQLQRINGLRWEKDWLAPLRKMAAAGITTDSSLGPESQSTQGYLFGTGLPYQVIDSNGLPLPIVELPFVLGSGAGPQARRTLRTLLDQSEEHYHQAITVRLSPDEFHKQPSVGTYRLWKEAYDLARRKHHWITDVATFGHFLRARRESVLTSTFQAGVLEVTAQAVAEGQAIALPAQWRRYAAHGVRVDGKAVEARRLRGVGGDLLLVRLARGTHVLRAEYTELP